MIAFSRTILNRDIDPVLGSSEASSYEHRDTENLYTFFEA